MIIICVAVLLVYVLAFRLCAMAKWCDVKQHEDGREDER